VVSIDYHSQDLHAQIVKAVGESIINNALEITISFVIGMIQMKMKKDKIKISVTFSFNDSDVMLLFRYRCRQYSPILNAMDRASHIDDFFKHYFDEIRHEYIHGENKLIFRYTMMSDEKMRKKYLDALDKNLSGKNEI
jgi:hypothetical protein